MPFGFGGRAITWASAMRTQNLDREEEAAGDTRERNDPNDERPHSDLHRGLPTMAP
jgi:hypothetical protein